MTRAQAALLSQLHFPAVSQVYDLEQLAMALKEAPRTPLVLGLRPHEHVVNLYRLRSLLTGRPVLFVGRCFYWTDHNLPEWLGLTQYGFGSWDAMQERSFRQMAVGRFRQFSGGDEKSVEASLPDNMTDMQIFEQANQWLFRKQVMAGLSWNEIRVLSLAAMGQKSRLPTGLRSQHKNNGLHKLGMTKHVMNLYRGVKVRPELQACLPSVAGEGVAEI
ncbi:TPA: hypothetical protein G8Z02_004580 [Salmonella enterica]|nr:hypothetical protein [Salmonella enterica]